MKRFIVCDDDVAFVEQMAQTLHALYPCRVEHMYGPGALEASLREDCSGSDVLLTDIELHGRNSIDIIRRYLKPSSPLQVIYVTGYTHYCTDVYDTKHSSFLVKPVTQQALAHAVEIAYRSLARDRENGITVRAAGGVRIISSASLLYTEVRGRSLFLVTDTERITANGRLKEFMDGLDRRFLQCHKSYVINMDRVREFSGTSFLMANGTDIPVSQTHRHEAREIFLRYVGEAE